MSRPELAVTFVWTGDKYRREYVDKLYRMIYRHLTPPFTVVPLTETNIGPQISWWGKMELFRPKRFSGFKRVFYLDLDTVITGGVDHIACPESEFMVLSDTKHPPNIGSGLMAWSTDSDIPNRIWDAWRQGEMCEGGDQMFIQKAVGTGLDRFQDFFPGEVRSYKRECASGVPEGTRIVYFHGYPMPHQVGGWVREHWR